MTRLADHSAASQYEMQSCGSSSAATSHCPSAMNAQKVTSTAEVTAAAAAGNSQN